MTIHLDHTIIPSRNKIASAKLLAELLGVSWAQTGVGPFVPVFVNDGLTLDFIDTDEDFPMYHLCFRVAQNEFDSISCTHQAGVRCAMRTKTPFLVIPIDRHSFDTQFTFGIGATAYRRRAPCAPHKNRRR